MAHTFLIKACVRVEPLFSNNIRRQVCYKLLWPRNTKLYYCETDTCRKTSPPTKEISDKWKIVRNNNKIIT